MNITFLTSSIVYPYGPGTGRIRLLTKALSEANITTTLLIATKSKSQTLQQGQLELVKYEYLDLPAQAFGHLTYPVDYTIDYKTFLMVYSGLSRKPKPDLYIIYSRNISLILAAALQARKYQVPLVLEICEWPVITPSTNSVIRLRKWLYCRYALNLASGAIPISTYIQQKINEFSINRKKILPSLLIPILVDCAEFVPKKIPPDPFFLLAGAKGYSDILLMTLRSFALLNKTSKFKLYFTGIEQKTAEGQQILAEAQQLGIGDAVTLTGYMEWQKYKELLTKATGLLIPLPATEQSIARFPSKLGEYMASGRPIVTTAIGDVSLYLRDQENAYLAEEATPKGISKQLQCILHNPYRASEIGYAGRTTAETKFDYRKYGVSIGNFLKQLLRP